MNSTVVDFNLSTVVDIVVEIFVEVAESPLDHTPHRRKKSPLGAGLGCVVGGSITAVLVARLVVAVATAVSALVHRRTSKRARCSVPTVAVFGRAVVIGRIPIGLRLLRPGLPLCVRTLHVGRVAILLHGVRVSRVIGTGLVSVTTKAASVGAACGCE